MDKKQAQLEEYKILLNDIQQRIRFRFQLFSLLLAALGFILPFGLKEQSSEILLVYPVVSFFLTLSWVHQSVVMTKISRYLKDHLEPQVDGLEWLAYISKDSERVSGFSIIGLFATSGFILFSQILMLALAFLIIGPNEKMDGLTILLGVVACMATLLTLLFLIWYSRMKR